MNKENNKQKHIYDYLLKVLSISKIGLLYSTDPYAIENYKKIRELSLDMLENIQDVDLEGNPFFKRDIYPTPNISVRTCIFNENDEVLLVKEKSDGGYSLPGGWCDLYDSPTEAAKRECKEEAGAEVEITNLIGILNRTPFKNKTSVPEYVIIFRGKLLKPLKGHDHEITNVAYFNVDNLPKLSKKVTDKEMIKMIKSAQKGDLIYD